MAPDVSRSVHGQPGRLVTELEVDQVHHPGLVGLRGHGLGVVQRAAEGLVAQHRPSGLQGHGHMVAVEERRRVDRDEIDLGSAQGTHGVGIPGRDHVGDLTPGGLEGPGHHPSTEAGADHADAHHPPIGGTAPTGTGPAAPRRPRPVGMVIETPPTSCSSMALPDGSSRKVWRFVPEPTGSAIVHSLGPELGHHGVEVGDPDGEVLAEVSRHRGLQQVDLLAAQVDPGAADPEVRPVGAQRTPEDVGVEGHRLGHVGHVDGHMVNGEWLHDLQSGPDGIGPQRKQPPLSMPRPHGWIT